MQQVLSVLWSLDNKFVLSGSDEMNIRLWKANASEKLGPVCVLLVFSLFSFINLYIRWVIWAFYGRPKNFGNLRFRLISLQLHRRERAAFNYNARLLEIYGEHPEVRRIVRRRFVPRPIYTYIFFLS